MNDVVIKLSIQEVLQGSVMGCMRTVGAIKTGRNRPGNRADVGLNACPRKGRPVAVCWLICAAGYGAMKLSSKNTGRSNPESFIGRHSSFRSKPYTQ